MRESLKEHQIYREKLLGTTWKDVKRALINESVLVCMFMMAIKLIFGMMFGWGC